MDPEESSILLKKKLDAVEEEMRDICEEIQAGFEGKNQLHDD